MKYAENLTQLIGNTPLVKLQETSENTGALVLGKCEFMNPTHSVKDRIGTNMINTALEQGLITKDTTVIEPTSGNTGIALASVCAALGIKLVLTMPSSMSIERRRLLKALGADLVLTEPAKGMKGAVDRANELAEETPNSFVPQQFNNGANPEIHRKTTAQEILADTDGKIDIFIAAIGTGGTITGVGEVLKAQNPDIQVIAVEPEDSPVLSGGKPGPHKIQGIGAGFVPGVLNTEIYDEVVQVSNDDSFAHARHLAKSEGLLVGISAGANALVAQRVAERPENKGKTIVTILCDTGERYLSTVLYPNDEE
ncbi:cysteine synthase A [Poseidonibacter lekithochrous]|uniref:cysteine synthase A n=1 Tax=Poseidonibacter lekithochrous TaxID=1904463 RepID=UPI0008FCD9EF|nr:cysteine synthase A [Poseidonibacter lekithochrous]QKJ24612.1 cysteine synthase [Poseidonibacter lekithochrous]